jgi:hypothetical protein
VRITLRGQGYWSYLGTDILTIPPNQPTMCLQNMDRQSEAELTRVVRHETGHTLGFPHEHLRREIVQRINPQAAYAFFGWVSGWGPRARAVRVLDHPSACLWVLLPRGTTGTHCTREGGHCDLTAAAATNTVNG